MKIRDLTSEKVDEGPLRTVGRGVAKGVGTVGRGVKAVAKGVGSQVGGLAQALQKGFGTGQTADISGAAANKDLFRLKKKDDKKKK